VDLAIPKEARARERRVALAPTGVRALVQQSHRVFVQTGAGVEAGYPDTEYQAAGATIVFSRAEALARGELVAAIFAPEAREYDCLRPGQVVFAFWGLPASRPDDLAALLARQVTAIGFEIIEDEQGRAPVLTSTSEIAGALAVTVGAGLLLNEFGGKGILLSGAPGVPPAHLVVLGAGVLGRSAARAALGLGAQVTLLDRSVQHLREAVREVGGPATTMLATRPNIEKALGFADLVLGAVAVRGERAPLLVTREMLKAMKPRSVVMDLAIDMGGCFESSRPTSFPSPVYEVDGILHFCVPNLPSAAARSATLALTNAVLPYLWAVADAGIEPALAAHAELRRGTYLHAGRCVHESLARAFGLDWEPMAGTGA
jgi:alanine dehydrogenase